MRECDKDMVIRMIEQHHVYRKIVEGLSAGNDFEVKWMRPEYLRESRETLGRTQEQAQMMECGIRRAVEAKRKRRGSEEEEEGRKVHSREEEQLEDLDSEAPRNRTK